MLNIIDLQETVFDAMDAFSSRNNGIEGIMLEDIQEAVSRRNGDEDDLRNATLIYAKYVLTEIAEILN